MRNILVVLCLAGVSLAQTRMIGEVIEKKSDGITVKTDAGETVNVPAGGETKVLRVPPGETSLSKAAAIGFSDIASGDRVLIRPNQIIVMSRSDLQQKQAAEHEDWRKRGTAGRITSLGADTVGIKTGAGQAVTITTTPQTQFRRYAPDSVRFADAKSSTFADLRVGDQVRVLGNRAGESINAEVVVSGSFRNFAGTVVSVDEGAGAITLTDLETKKPVAVKVNSDTKARKIAPMMAQRLAQLRNAPGNVEGNAGPRDFGQMLDRMPPLQLSELKPGDALLVASTVGSEAFHATAVALVAGVEPLLTGPPADRRLTGPWSLDIDIAP